MRSPGRRWRKLGDLHREFALHGDAIRQRLGEFAALPASEYFYEAAYCLLTPQSSAAHAVRAIAALREADFHEKDADVAAILRRKEHYIRFHNMKAERVARLKMTFPEILDRLAHERTGAPMREWLVRNVSGFGWKEASHFLRNIGYRDLAILDRHILKNLHSHGVIRSVPRTLTAKQYLVIERKFARFAASIGICMDELDLLFWRRETGEILK